MLSLFFFEILRQIQTGLQIIHNVVMIWSYLCFILIIGTGKKHTFPSLFYSLSIPFANNTQQNAPAASRGFLLCKGHFYDLLRFFEK